LLPVIGLIQVGGQAHADRYSYVPHIGLFVMTVWLTAELGRLGSGARYGLGAATVVILAASFATLRHELKPWHDSKALWERALLVNPDSGMVHHNMGDALLKRKCLEEAKSHFQQAIDLNPNHVQAILALASFHLSEHNIVEARAYVEWASRLSPDDPQCRMFRELLKKHGRDTDNAPRGPRPEPTDAAREAFRRGLNLARRGDMAAAEAAFITALKHEPRYAEAHNNLGLVLFERGRLQDAESHFQLAIDGDPRNADFACNLASLLESQSRWSEALSQLEKVLELKPTDAEARIRLERLQRRVAPGAESDLRP
jgi:Tfp pilus assembly protein PilF